MQVFFGRLGNDQLVSKGHLNKILEGFIMIGGGHYLLLTEEIRLTTWDVKNPVNNGINYLSTGAGFLPLTVWVLKKVTCHSTKLPHPQASL